MCLAAVPELRATGVGRPSSPLTGMAYETKSCAPNHCSQVSADAFRTWGAARKPLA
jgi:hypothetical protein